MYRIALLIILIMPVWMPVWQVSGAQDLPPRSDIRILIISDFNSRYGSTDYPWHVDSVIARAPGWDADLVLTAGDMIAGQRTTLTDENVQKMWNVFDERILSPLTRNGIPFGFTLGNHDASASPAFGRDRRFARDFWLDPARDPLLNFHDRSQYPFYFSFTYEELFIVSWYASSAEIGDEQREWLQEQLTSEAATDASYRILLGHLPVHAVAEGRNSRGENLGDTGALMQLIGELGIDLYICGHHHAFYPARKNGIRFIHAGAIGDGPRPLVGSTLPPRKAFTILDMERQPVEDPGEYGDDSAQVYEQGLREFNLRRTSFDPEDWSEISEAELPRFIRGINGYVIRDGLVPDSVYSGTFSPLNSAALLPQAWSGTAEYRAELSGDTFRIWVRSGDDDSKAGSGSDLGSVLDSGQESGAGTENESETMPVPGSASQYELKNKHRGGGIAVSLRMGTPAEKGEILARTAFRNINNDSDNDSGSGTGTGSGNGSSSGSSIIGDGNGISSNLNQNPVEAELIFSPDIREREALAAGLLFLAIETDEFPDGAARVHLYPADVAPRLQSGSPDGSSLTLTQPGPANVNDQTHQNSPVMLCDSASFNPVAEAGGIGIGIGNGIGNDNCNSIDNYNGKSIRFEWNRVHPLTAEPVFYSIDVSADPNFGSLTRRIPAGTGLLYMVNETTLSDLTTGTGVQPDQLMFRITATDGVAHCSSSPFHIQNENE